MPRWMKWIFLVFLGYILYLGNFTSNTPPLVQPIKSDTPQAAPTKEPLLAPSKRYDALARFTDADRWRRALNPKYVGNPDFKDVVLGSGTAVGCGSTVTLHLRGTLSDGSNFDETHKESEALHFVVGKAPYGALNEGVIGMQKGGVRQLKASPLEVYKGKPPNLDSVLFRIEMDAVTPASDTDLPLSFMRVAPSYNDHFAEIHCGKQTDVEIIWFDNAGRKIRKDTATITLGEGEFGIGVDRVVQGMLVGEVRYGVLPPVWQKPGAKSIAHVLITRLIPTKK